MIRRFIFVILTLFSFACAQKENPVGEKIDYLKLHYDAIVADTHNDVLLRAMDGEDISLETKRGHSDLVRLKKGGVDIQVFAVWVDPVAFEKNPFKRANQMIDTLYSIASRNPDKIAVVRNSSELEKALSEGKICAVIGVEGGHAIENSIENLERLYKRGVRYLGLTWNNSVDWASSAFDETTNPEKLKVKGLSEFGKKVVEKMNELGMLVDVSHLGEQAFWDVIKVTKKPVIASHSSVYNLCPHYRNLKDEQIKAIAQTGGVIFVNFYAEYIDSAFNTKRKQLEEKYKTQFDSIRILYEHNPQEYRRARRQLMMRIADELRPPLDVLIDHIDYIAKLVGVEHVGLGSDFDGISVTPLEMDDVTFLPNITKKLLERGYSIEDVKKILGGNFVRVFKQVCG
ncbi:membrane dipeptidase [Candidatus Kryptonium thompsonii]|jgi:membrane dipeptidase|uniref:Membrane dipeptidase n=1 Tax=Candidatus Kryptonium thompsonii TaxID=1633631 RepID=A0A0P1MHX2_9BACT|nr:dipeptidase [Candidatus Kryptonium thompsoni]CUS80757.1 membrane dipeptidase [Candidatus Kryptonium thompsoni]CUS82387.1 membrane dipeptidase [Candidatus Kryptonium thompsoni]CUS85834.1 membrane dipeptidase [Candidatus Kryptonium thompsoni]CUS94054.1 membrane dipeptidase [Candidatus Kryptonium thompsoni]CUS94253.1 membrane dipeptidase [Candidatus Kryptonium thompsoni]